MCVNLHKHTHNYINLQIQCIMAKIRKNISIEDSTDKTIKKIAKAEMRTESAVVELAIKQYAARKAAATN